MKLTTKCGTPLYAAAFYDSETLIVAGGGGPGAHGVLNKVLIYRTSAASLEAIAEYELPPNSDSPSALAVDADKVIWVAANTFDPKTKKPAQLLALRFDASAGELCLLSAHAVLPQNDSGTYPKSVSTAGALVGCASSDSAGTFVLLNPETREHTAVSFDEELVDSALSLASAEQPELVAGATERALEFRAVARPNVRYVPPIPAPNGGRWARVCSMYPGRFAAAATLGARAGAQLSIVTVRGFGEARVSHTVRVPNLKSVTALASNGSRVVLASADGQIAVYNALVAEPTLVAQRRGVHALPVTALALADDGNSVASTSMDGSLVVSRGLDQTVSLAATLGWATLSALLIMLLGLLIALATFPQLQSTSIGAGLLDIKARYEEAMGYHAEPTYSSSLSANSGSSYESIYETSEPTPEHAAKPTPEPTDEWDEESVITTPDAVPSDASEQAPETPEHVPETPEATGEWEEAPVVTAPVIPKPTVPRERTDEWGEAPEITTPVIPKPTVHREL